MTNKVSFSRQHSSLENIEGYYADSENSLNNYFNSSSAGTLFPIRFFGYNTNQIDNELKTRKESLDRMCSLEILSSIEAKLKIDYLVRCQNKQKDDLSKIFYEIYKIKRDKPSLADDIVRTWRIECPQHKTRMDNLGKALYYRNWLAHGRYWLPKKSPHISRYDYLAIYALASDIITNMDLHEN